mmetsp:Transcript_21168/g.59242  ORF Transcript_21168/g.59242 Transcript_21168/m.59242 type:complete len:189 (-) Transcript_21168:64-630(-)
MRLSSHLLPLLLAAAALALVAHPLLRASQSHDINFVGPPQPQLSSTARATYPLGRSATGSDEKDAESAEELLAKARELREESLKAEGNADAAARAAAEQKSAMAAMPAPAPAPEPARAAPKASARAVNEPKEVMMPDPEEFVDAFDGGTISLLFFLGCGALIFCFLGNEGYIGNKNAGYTSVLADIPR